MLEARGRTRKLIDRLCVISFDEVKVSEVLEYDSRYEEFIGPHKQMQVSSVTSYNISISYTGTWSFVPFNNTNFEGKITFLYP